MTENALPEYELEIATLTDIGTQRSHNEDFCAFFNESGSSAVVGVADGVSSCEGGEVASQLAIEAMIRAYCEEPPARSSGQRLYNAVQSANIEVYDRASIIPELRGMTTTLTAAAVERAELTVIHIGDSRLYLVRGGTITQLTKDHTVVAERARMGLISEERAKSHPDRSVLTRSLGRELIVSRDRISRQLVQGDALLFCSDGLYNVLDDSEMKRILADRDNRDPGNACRALIGEANRRGTPDNLTVAVVRLVGPTPALQERRSLGTSLRRLLGKR